MTNRTKRQHLPKYNRFPTILQCRKITALIRNLQRCTAAYLAALSCKRSSSVSLCLSCRAFFLQARTQAEQSLHEVSARAPKKSGAPLPCNFSGKADSRAIVCLRQSVSGKDKGRLSTATVRTAEKNTPKRSRRLKICCSGISLIHIFIGCLDSLVKNKFAFFISASIFYPAPGRQVSQAAGSKSSMISICNAKNDSSIAVSAARQET